MTESSGTPPPSAAERRISPPRLVMRFAVYTAIVLAVGSACILLFVRHDGTAQAERAVKFHARFVADSILASELRPSDFEGPVGDVRRARLDRMFRRQVLLGGALEGTLYSPGGLVTYSTNHALIGTSALEGGRVDGALAGRVSSRVTTIQANGTEAKVLETDVPVQIGGNPLGAFSLDQDYAPISRSAWKAFVPVAGVLELVLLTLYVSLFPIMRRVTNRLRRQVQEIEHQALHDGLTGLPNRDLFRDRVQQALVAARRSGSGATVFLLDLDRFKEVNDTLGHQSGDLLLQAVGERLRSLLRESDTVARLGGDEFAVLSPAATDAPGALLLAERIQLGMEEPFVVADLRLEVEASIGIALFPDHGEDVDTLIRHADIAMYLSKETHGPKLYTPSRDHYSTARLSLVGELRRAIENQELVVYYQPRVDLVTREVRNLEALVRWRHPERGLLAAGAFVPLTEHTGLVRPLTRYVLDVALEQCRTWADAGLDLAVAVNLFGRDLLDVGLPDEVSDLLAKWDVPAERRELEITENTILSDPTRAREILIRLSERGVRLAIDDFGSGYSSLNYLKRLPAHVLKIDKSFVLKMADDENDAVIVRSTIDLGHNLGLEVVAEGVEDKATWDRLAALGCDTAQGYFLSRPVTAARLEKWLAHWNERTRAIEAAA